MPDVKPAPRPARRRGRAVLFGFGLVLAAEVLLRISPLAPPSRDEWNRQYGVISIEHYYAQAPAHVVELGADEGGRWCGPASALTASGDPYIDAMQPARWRCDKPAGTFRIVVLGESSVQGLGLQPGQTLPDQLGAALAGRGTPIEVINAGVAGYNSLQIRRMLPELWRLSPDLFVLYAGHNDFTYYAVVEAALAARPALLRVRALGDQVGLVRLGRTAAVRVGVLPPPPPIPPARQGELPTPSTTGPAAYNQPPLSEPRTEAEHAVLMAAQKKAAVNIRSLYADSVKAMVDEARAHGAAFALATPVSKLDGKIGRSIHWTYLPPEKLAQWDQLWPGVRDARDHRPDPRVPELLRLDDDYADLHQAIGLQEIAAGRRESALAHFVWGLDHMAPTRSDRAPWGFGDDVIALGRELEVPVLDLRPTIAATITAPPPGPDAVFLDVLHFSADGARLVAGKLAAFLDEHALIPR
jgi:lysophospholipase L1-like esterase